MRTVASSPARSVRANDINRHLPELDRRAPHLEDGVEVERPPLEYLNRELMDDMLAQALRMGAEFDPDVSPVEFEGLEMQMRQFINAVVVSRNAYAETARDLDEGAGHESGAGELLGSAVVMGLDFVAFTFTFFALGESVSLKMRGYSDIRETLAFAVPVAAATSVAMRFGAREAGRSAGWMAAYVFSWACFAVADISYLMRKGIANVGLAMTGLLAVMCLVTLGHGRASAAGSGRRRKLQAHARAYKDYAIKLGNLARAIERIQRDPDRGLASILRVVAYEAP